MDTSEGLRIGAFNVKSFGEKKVGDSKVVEALVKIIRRYDIVLVLEIQDHTGKAVSILLEQINKGSHGTEYKFDISIRQGRTKYTKQYAFFYRSDKVNLRTYQYPDNDNNFERPPFAVHVTSDCSAVKEFALIGIHTKPKDAINEINNLIEVCKEVKTEFDTKNILILGDLNAGGKYVPIKKLPELRLKTDPTFHWLIDDDTDTVVSEVYRREEEPQCLRMGRARKEHKAFDRFVMSGDDFRASLVTDSAQVYRFDQEQNLNDKKTLAVSDHFPIELRLKGRQQPTVGDGSGSSAETQAASDHLPTVG